MPKKPVVKYTKSGCKIVYEEVGKPSERYSVELEKKNGELITRKIWEE